MDYKVKLGNGWLSICKSGSLDLTATIDAIVDLQVGAHAQVDTHAHRISSRTGNSEKSIVLAQINMNDSRPILSVAQCSSSVYGVYITLHGGIIDDIINVFKGIVEHYVKNYLSDHVCKKVSACLRTRKGATSAAAHRCGD